MKETIETLIKELEDEFELHWLKYKNQEKINAMNGIIDTLGYYLNSAKYAEWRQKVKIFVLENFDPELNKELLQMLDKQKELIESKKNCLVGLLRALCFQATIKSKTLDAPDEVGVFISHSHHDLEFVEKLAVFLEKVGIPSANIFCSSIEGQGVKNGEKIEEAVREHLISSKLLLYIISPRFLQSTYCIQELGAGWILRDERVSGKKVFLLKFDDVVDEMIKGFINSDFKYSELSQDSLTGLIDDISDLFSIPNRKATENNKLCKVLLSAKQNATTEHSKSPMPPTEKTILDQESIIKKLTNLEREIIASIYFSEEKCLKLSPFDGVTIQMEEKKIIRRLSDVGRRFSGFPYALQNWLIECIDENEEFSQSLKSLLKK